MARVPGSGCPTLLRCARPPSTGLTITYPAYPHKPTGSGPKRFKRGEDSGDEGGGGKKRRALVKPARGAAARRGGAARGAAAAGKKGGTTKKAKT